MRITGLKLENIGAFEQVDLTFPAEKPAGKAEIHLFTGENGTGKSTLLQALSALFQGHNQVQDSLFKRKFRGKGKLFEGLRIKTPEDKSGKANFYINAPNAEAVSLEIFNETLASYPLILASSDPRTRFTKDFWDYLEYLQRTQEKSEVKYACFAYSGARSIQDYEIDGIKETFDNPIIEAPNFERPTSSKTLLQWIANTKAKEALTLISNPLESERYKEAILRVEKVVEDITGWKVIFIFNYNPFSVQVQVNDILLDFDILPDGLKSIISWIADLLMRMDRIVWEGNIPVFEREFVLLLDEIEVHLHPKWQRKILPVVQGLFPNAQIFIATHSPFVVGSVEGAWVYEFELDKNGNSILREPPQKSNPAHSYQYVLADVFDIKAEFGEEVEKKLQNFYQLRDKILNGQHDDNLAEFLRVARELTALNSIEIQDTVTIELRRLNRLTQKNYQL